MSVTCEVGLDQVFSLARQLSREEQMLLAEKLTAADNAVKPVVVTPVEITVSTGLPFFAPDDLALFQENRTKLEASIDWEQVRRNNEALEQLLRECPTATEEEIEMQHEIRRSMERWRT